MPTDETAGIYARESPVLGRFVQLGIAQGRVLSVDFPQTPDDAEAEHDLLDRIEAYLDGEPDDFTDVTVAMTMPTTVSEVLSAVREVPYGESASIEQITMMVPGRDADDEEDRAAVRDALGENPAPILIPTHRVRGGRRGEPADVGEQLRSIEGI